MTTTTTTAADPGRRGCISPSRVAVVIRRQQADPRGRFGLRPPGGGEGAAAIPGRTKSSSSACDERSRVVMRRRQRRPTTEAKKKKKKKDEETEVRHHRGLRDGRASRGSQQVRLRRRGDSREVSVSGRQRRREEGTVGRAEAKVDGRKQEYVYASQRRATKGRKGSSSSSSSSLSSSSSSSSSVAGGCDDWRIRRQR
ncbi:hypothetical protein ACHAW5_000205 [Stephanodiscus triporus]|uniref:Uncharacterized protein n=1 Tax=Stephanodiscus triporus TaxID=2934178 RepID=A0ABD3MFH1_9STRA